MVGIMVLIFSYVFKFQSVQCKKLARMHKYVANIHFKVDNDILSTQDLEYRTGYSYE
jgi:hypothetical protein